MAKKADVVVVKTRTSNRNTDTLHASFPWAELGQILLDVQRRRLQGKSVINLGWGGSVGSFVEAAGSDPLAKAAYDTIWKTTLDRASELGVTFVVPAALVGFSAHLGSQPARLPGGSIDLLILLYPQTPACDWAARGIEAPFFDVYPAHLINRFPELDLIVVGSVNAAGMRSNFSSNDPGITASAVGDLFCATVNTTIVKWSKCQGTAHGTLSTRPSAILGLPFFFVFEIAAAQVSGLVAYLISLNGDKIDAGGWLKCQVPGKIKAMVKKYSYSRRYSGSATAAPYDPIAYPEYPPVAYNNIHGDADDYCDLPRKMPGSNYETGFGRWQALKRKKGNPMDGVEKNGWGRIPWEEKFLP